MLIAERQQRILDYLAQHGRGEQSALADMLGVSIDTIRRDLQSLAETGRLVRVRGGALAALKTRSMLTYSERLDIDVAEKRALCRAAAEQINPNETVFVCHGSTTSFLADYLPEDIPLLIVTNSTELATRLAAFRNMTLWLTGGQLRADSAALVGPLTEQVLNGLTFDKALLTASGIQLRQGVTATSPEMAALLALANRQSRETILLQVASKLGRRGFASAFPVSNVDLLLTSTEADTSAVEELKKAGLRLSQVEPIDV